MFVLYLQEYRKAPVPTFRLITDAFFVISQWCWLLSKVLLHNTHIIALTVENRHDIDDVRFLIIVVKQQLVLVRQEAIAVTL